MPTSATHITIVRRIADSGPQYRALLGDPDPTLPLTDPAAQRMRFASLGACGPDFLYLLMDYGSDAQDLANLLVRAAAAFDSLASLMAGVQERIDGLVSSITMGVSDSIKEQAGLLSAVIQEGLFATLASGGFNPRGARPTTRATSGSGPTSCTTGAAGATPRTSSARPTRPATRT